MNGLISCPACARQYKWDASTANCKGRCDACGETFVIVFATPSEAVTDPIVFSQAVEPHYVFFREGCEKLARNAADLLEAAGISVTPANVAGVITSMPRSHEELLDPSWRDGLCNRALREAFVRGGSPEATEALRGLMAYFLEDMPGLSFQSREMLDAAFSGILDGAAWTRAEETRAATGRNPVAAQELSRKPRWSVAWPWGR